MSLTSKNKINYVITAILIIVVGYLLVGFLRARTTQTTADKEVGAAKTEDLKQFRKVKIGTTVINAEVVSREEDLIRGLSGRASLATSTGMLFVFDHPDKWGIWMKDMNFPIDVVWLDKDLKVNHIVKSMMPGSYPVSYSPAEPALYVLELPEGEIERSVISIGQKVVIE
jgi:uncharacterized protein